MRRTFSAAMVAISLVSACSSSKPAKVEPSTIASAATTTTAVAATSPATTAPITIAPTTTTPTTTTIAPTTTTVPLKDVFQDLIDRYDAVVAAILADPRVAADSSNPKVVAFLALFPPNSSFTGTTLKFWEDEGSQGRFYRAGPGGAISKSTVKGVKVTSATEASFDVCVVKSTTIVDAAGNMLESSGGPAAGTIVAVNLDGKWLIRDLTRTSPEACLKPGAAG
jgi:hypothetical protein